MTRKRRLRKRAMQALGLRVKESGGKLPFLLIPVTIVVSSLAAGHVTGSTLALSQDTDRGPNVEFRTLTTDEVLRFTSGRLKLLSHPAEETVGSEIRRTFHVLNISNRRVSLKAELTGIPWATVELSQTEIGPGEVAEIIVRGTPEEPGDYKGELTVYGMGGFLELAQQFAIHVLPAPEEDVCAPADLAGDQGQDGVPATDQQTPDGEAIERDVNGAQGELTDVADSAVPSPQDDPCNPVATQPEPISECVLAPDAALREEDVEEPLPGCDAPTSEPPAVPEDVPADMPREDDAPGSDEPDDGESAEDSAGAGETPAQGEPDDSPDDADSEVSQDPAEDQLGDDPADTGSGEPEGAGRETSDGDAAGDGADTDHGTVDGDAATAIEPTSGTTTETTIEPTEGNLPLSGENDAEVEESQTGVIAGPAPDPTTDEIYHGGSGGQDT